jgi:hypothetical protein
MTRSVIDSVASRVISNVIHIAPRSRERTDPRERWSRWEPNGPTKGTTQRRRSA